MDILIILRHYLLNWTLFIKSDTIYFNLTIVYLRAGSSELSDGGYYVHSVLRILLKKKRPPNPTEGIGGLSVTY